MNKTDPVALYRKYRPQNFSDVIGQDQVVKVLEGSIKLSNISHAYLFAGSRGTGKTSVARIFAKDIGCSQTDLYEIDAASNRGIDDVRAIRESVLSLPFESPYKVYIIDEAHMLTKEAWNAFLKTLEEPPRHAIFILATTEIEKVPETVFSRCQVFSFKRPGQKVLKELALSIAKKEGFTLEPSSAELIAVLSEGSFRDAQGILQKVLSFGRSKKIDPEEVEIVTGAPRGKLVNGFIEAIAERKIDKALGTVARAKNENIDIKVFLKLVLQKLRAVLLLRYAGEMEKEFAEDFSDEDLEFLKKVAAKGTDAISSATLAEFLSAHDMVSRTAIPELPVELALVKLLVNNNSQS
ncbi:DNA polymerase III subunit gamma/tau [Patescibacteria group bacterium]|nr:MAG: DNA polymerase III subunit gamma/tau [Patescibacteria group bacterium]